MAFRLAWFLVVVVAMGSASACSDGGRSGGDGRATTGGLPGPGSTGSPPLSPMCGVDFPVPEPGADRCLACAAEHCCLGAASAGDCLKGAPASTSCYGGYFGTGIVPCFEDAIAAGSTLDSWHVVAKCVDDHASRFGPTPTVPFPHNDLSDEFVECIVGTFPAPRDDDAGADDAGARVAPPPDPRFLGVDTYPGRCARECFPSWR